MSELALKLIREAKETKAKKLDLGNCGLTELPDELFELVWLEELYLCDNSWYVNHEKDGYIDFVSRNKGEANNIKWISPKMTRLRELKTLLLDGDIGGKIDLDDLTPLKGLLSLQVISFSDSNVNDLGPIKDLMNLKYLNFNSTSVTNFDGLENLIELRNISCAFTQIENLFSIKKLLKLQFLNLNNTPIQDIEPVSFLLNLKDLYLRGTNVFNLTALTSLSKLENLWIDESNVNDLSPLQKLQKLEQISIFSTQISDLSPLKNLKNLYDINIQNTKVSDLSPLKELIEKKVLVKWSKHEGGISVQDCPLTNPPIEIAQQGNEAILNYWKQIEEQGTKNLNEAKLIIVGEGNTGKTTLFNKLVDPKFDLSKELSEETKGINIHEGLEIKEDFRANLWDFGGQELQYMTHQFFLTPNSVYVLMMAAREEAPNLAYWFKIISLLGKDKTGGKVSLIIVLNKKKGSTGMPKYHDLLEIYADDFDYQFIEVDLAVNDMRWESLRESIENRLVNLPIVKNELPKQWNPIRDALRELARKKPYINAESLQTVCEPLEVTEEADQFLMTDYLHQLGSLLHFQGEEDNLMDLIVLSPEWVVEGVYTVLKSERIKSELKGKFSATEMTKILCANQYKIGEKEKKYTRVDAQKLIQLMSKNNFDICYKSESGKYVAAQLLPDDRPTNYRWNKSYNAALQFRYQYPIMPKGLMSRLIVRLSDHLEIIDKQEIVWKKGAILNIKVNGSVCRVLMREEDGETKTGLRQIVIEVLESTAPFINRKYALHEVRKEIESLHKRWFKNIDSEQIIPCNCEDCADSDKPYTYELTELMKLKKGRAYCNKLEDFVPLKQLLEGVYETKEIESFAQEERMKRR